MQTFHRYQTIPGIFLCLLASSLMLFACRPTGDDLPKDPDEKKIELEADEAAEYLTLNNATKVSGQLSDAPDGQLTINVKDTIYSIKGYSDAAPIMMVRHTTAQEISGFFVGVSGASFYYQLPLYEGPNGPAPTEADSVAIFIIDFQPPESVVFPYTIEIVIQPHGPDELPIDEFVRKITVEDPEDEDHKQGTCGIMTQNPCPGQKANSCSNPHADKYWAWESTKQEDDGYIYTSGVYRFSPVWEAHGCCTPDGHSISAASEPRCRPGVNNWEFKILDVGGTGHMRSGEVLAIFDDGTFFRSLKTNVQNFDSQNSDFCSEEKIYINLLHQRQTGGTHNYSPGDKQIQLTDDPNQSQPGMIPFVHRGGDLVHTCHSMMIREGLETRSIHIYRRLYGPNVTDDGVFDYDFSDQFWE